MAHNVNRLIEETEERYIVIFDGICRFCNRSVDFIIKRDPAAKFAFLPMQSDVAVRLAAELGINNLGEDTFVLIKNRQCYFYSTAALEITRDLTGFWPWLRLAMIFPAPIRDACYRWVARRRYRLFGKREQCVAPSAEKRARFIS
ncbi:DUF393 domain-containing protein [Alteromonas pelagimontana]|uniref:DUF393 domain-containing protein n=1 Tax=Alteromonas pelagimontana TaxID=1858656 RepID=A0A6M4MGJ0_9ALTE|nr:DCC1-like thiol-disulfide oxidoreductase family protein [Alteromonas pelagimontana]QJR82239.1 DUF393 domain-containing protein [Alteromonas pelagimontana]